MPILGLNLFNHANRVGVGLRGGHWDTLLGLDGANCRLVELLLPLLVTLLDENDRVNPRRLGLMVQWWERVVVMMFGVCATE